MMRMSKEAKRLRPYFSRYASGDLDTSGGFYAWGYGRDGIVHGVHVAVSVGRGGIPGVCLEVANYFIRGKCSVAATCKVDRTVMLSLGEVQPVLRWLIPQLESGAVDLDVAGAPSSFGLRMESDERITTELWREGL